MSTLYEQLEKYCDCLQGTFSGKDKEKIEKNIEEMVNYVSMLTCWMQHPCETFLTSLRKEIFTIEDLIKCGCNAGITSFALFYDYVSVDEMIVKVIIRDGLDEEVVSIDSSKFKYSEVDNHLRIDLSDYIINDKCSCSKIEKIIVEYYAGYDEIPECILPLFCDLLHVITDKNNCDCNVCQSCKGDTLDIDADGDVQIYGDEVVAQALDTYVTNLIKSGYKMQIEMISLCQKRKLFVGIIV